MTLPSFQLPHALQPSANQARLLSLKVGDTIQSLQKHDDGWYEVRITLLWLGQFYTDWIVSERDDRQGPWSDPRKTKNWHLPSAKWERVETPPEHAAFMDDLAVEARLTTHA